MKFLADLEKNAAQLLEKNALAKLDFQHEGTMKDCEIKNGQFISLGIYVRLKTI